MTYSDSWPKHLIYASQFIVKLKTANMAVADITLRIPANREIPWCPAGPIRSCPLPIIEKSRSVRGKRFQQNPLGY